jgi:hypothetical protein
MTVHVDGWHFSIAEQHQIAAVMATPMKAAPSPARRLMAMFTPARKCEPSSARRSVSYPKVL